MGTYEQLKQAIAQVVKPNNNQEITGANLQNVLKSMVTSLGEGATFKGKATPDTAPGTPDQNVFYIAAQSGTYSNFDGSTLNGNEVGVFFTKGGAWAVAKLNIAQASYVEQLQTNITQQGGRIFNPIYGKSLRMLGTQEMANADGDNYGKIVADRNGMSFNLQTYEDLSLTDDEKPYIFEYLGEAKEAGANYLIIQVGRYDQFDPSVPDDSTDGLTFKGAFNNLCQELFYDNYNRVALILPYTIHEIDVAKKEWIKKRAELHQLPYLDLWAMSGYSYGNSPREMFTGDDNLSGYTQPRLADIFESFLRSI